MPGGKLILLHPKVPFLIAHVPITLEKAAKVRKYLDMSDDIVTALWRANVSTNDVPMLRMILLEMRSGGHSVKDMVAEYREDPEPEPERPLSRMVMWNQVSGHELQFDMTADEMLEWQRLRKDGVNQYEALLRVMHKNEGVRKRIALHQKEAERYLREGGARADSIVARPRGETRVVPIEEEDSSMSSSSTSTAVAAASKPTEAELLKSAVAFLKELAASQAFKDFAALTVQFAKVHLTSALEPVPIRVPQVDKAGAPAKPVEVGKLGTLAHALAVVQALPLPKKVKELIANATSSGRTPTTPDALSAARTIVQSQLVKKPGSLLSATNSPAAPTSPPVAAAAVVEQVAQQQAVAASVGKKRKSVDRTPVQSPVAVATTPEKPASSPKKRTKVVVDADMAASVKLNDEIEAAMAKKPSPKVRKVPSVQKKASVTSVGGSADVATELAAGLVGASGANGGDWDHLEAMAH